jgi:hyperosmotically inducible protein
MLRGSCKRVLAIAFCAFLCACSGKQQQQAQQSTESAALVAQVQTKLALVDADAATQVKVDVDRGVVTLSGEAHTRQERAAYESAAASVSGVTRVVDRLRVNPALRGPRETLTDAALAAKVNANIAAQAGVNVARVKTGVRDGIVTLDGSVPSASVKATIVDTVRRTSGVKNVIDRIEVKP